MPFNLCAQLTLNMCVLPTVPPMAKTVPAGVEVPSCYNLGGSATVFCCTGSCGILAFKATGLSVLGKKSDTRVTGLTLALVREAAIYGALHKVGCASVVKSLGSPELECCGQVIHGALQEVGCASAVKSLHSEVACCDTRMLLQRHGVVPLCAKAQDGTYLALGMASPWVRGGPITSDHRLVMKRVTEADRLDFLMTAMEGLGYLHRLGLAHRDLKPANIVLERTATGRAVALFIDFEGSNFPLHPVDEHSLAEREREAFRIEVNKRWHELVRVVAPCDLSRREKSTVDAPSPAPGWASPRAVQSVDLGQQAAPGTAKSVPAPELLPSTSPSVDDALDMRGVGQGQYGTQFWRGSKRPQKGHEFQADLSAMAVIAVSLAMGEEVAKRVMAFWADQCCEGCENLVFSWLDSSHASELAAPAHTLAATVREGLKFRWDRRKSKGGWEDRRTSDSCAGALVLPPAEWHRSETLADAIVLLVTNGERGGRDFVCTQAFEMMRSTFLHMGLWDPPR